jgi:hypothetical protein
MGVPPVFALKAYRKDRKENPAKDVKKNETELERIS